jgi:SHS2 domain-containing protein
MDRRMTYKMLDHTADIAVEVSAATRDELFAEALRALTDCVTELERVEPRERRSLDLGARELDLLLVDWLGELLAAFEVEGLLFCRAEATVADEPGALHLTAKAWGEPYDPSRHPLKVMIKGVTYHGLEAGPRADGSWRARVIFDV